ncbi:MAG: MerR family transcriptional regulator [Polyangiaceae bacterium]
MEGELVKMATLVKLSEVPAATIKHYVREGLLPPPAKRTARNMAYYDRSLVDRIRAIKRLQREHFLPLSVIRDMLEGAQDQSGDLLMASAVDRALGKMAVAGGKSRAELLAAGVVAADLDRLEAMGVIRPVAKGKRARYGGDDVALLRTLGAARKAGLAPEMLPIDILQRYLEALRNLVTVELEMFRHGVLPAAGERTEDLTEAATVLSERLVVLLRRRLLLPLLAEAMRAAVPAKRRGNQ